MKYVIIMSLVAIMVLTAAVSCSKKDDGPAKQPAMTPAGETKDAAKSDADKVAAPPENTAAEKPQTMCPIMNRAIDKTLYTDYNGKRVYFCCAGCIDMFKEAPEKYMKKMADEGIRPEDAPKQ